MDSIRFGVSRSSRQMQTRTTRTEMRLLQQEDEEDGGEWYEEDDWVEDYPYDPIDSDWYDNPDPFFHLF